MPVAGPPGVSGGAKSTVALRAAAHRLAFREASVSSATILATGRSVLVWLLGFSHIGKRQAEDPDLRHSRSAPGRRQRSGVAERNFGECSAMTNKPSTAGEPADAPAAARELADALTALTNYIEAARQQSSDVQVTLTKAAEQLRRANAGLARLRAALK
jgi:hypothetical protein